MTEEYNHVPFTEIIERVKDIISNEVIGKIYDYHVADALWLEYSSVRMYKAKNYLPLKNVIIFCQANNISVDWMLFSDLSFEEFSKSVY